MKFRRNFDDFTLIDEYINNTIVPDGSGINDFGSFDEHLSGLG
jgi:hypothetical protein